MRTFDTSSKAIRDFINEHDGHPWQVLDAVRRMRGKGEVVSEHMQKVEKLALKLMHLDDDD